MGGAHTYTDTQERQVLPHVTPPTPDTLLALCHTRLHLTRLQGSWTQALGHGQSGPNSQFQLGQFFLGLSLDGVAAER